jgi:hypothetical protein
MRDRFRQRGFTFVELCLGLLVTALVMSALATFTLAMCSAWQGAGQTATLTLKGNQIAAVIQKEVRNSLLLGACQAGSSDGSAAAAAVLIWKNDLNSDGFIQAGEVDMLMHDTANHQLVLYSGTPSDLTLWSYSTVFKASGTISGFISGRHPVVLASNVYGVVFATSSATSTTLNPSLQFALKILSNDAAGTPQMMVQYGAVTLRSPAAQPNN